MPESAARLARPAPIPFVDLQAQRRRLGTRIDRAIARVLEHGGFIMGPEVHELERQLAAFCGAKHAIACGNGTVALHLALLAAGSGPGDAVFVPSFTFTATAEVVVLVGATPVFVDVLEDSFNLDPDSLEAAVAATRDGALRPAAVIAVDLFGQPADYDRLEPIAAEHGLRLIVDAAQSFGATYRGRRAGAIGAIATTSFYPSKPLSCYGDGGAIFTDDEELAAVLRSLRWHGMGSEPYDNPRVGMNGRLDTIQAAILLEKLTLFPGEILARQRVAERYTAALQDIAAVPPLSPDTSSVWAQYTLQLEDRDRIARELKAVGVPTAVHYPRPLHQQTAYGSYPTAPGGLPVSERLAQRVLSLPIHAYLDPGTQDRIIDELRATLA